MALRMAKPKVRQTGRCSPNCAACSCATCNSSTSVATLSSTNACNEISVNSSTKPSCPYAKPTSGTPIIKVLLKILAKANTEARLSLP